MSEAKPIPINPNQSSKRRRPKTKRPSLGSKVVTLEGRTNGLGLDVARIKSKLDELAEQQAKELTAIEQRMEKMVAKAEQSQTAALVEAVTKKMELSFQAQLAEIDLLAKDVRETQAKTAKSVSLDIVDARLKIVEEQLESVQKHHETLEGLLHAHGQGINDLRKRLKQLESSAPIPERNFDFGDWIATGMLAVALGGLLKT